MKTKHRCITLIFSGCCLMGCTDFLSVVPDSQYSVAGSYKTQNDFKQAIAGVYSQQQRLFESNVCYFRGTIGRSDDTRGGANYLDGLDRFTDDDNNNWATNGWNDMWKIINLSNLILAKIDEGQFTDETMKDYIRGEAHMFRAYGYWNLAWQFGGMPLIDKPLSIDEVKKIPRSEQAATFDFAAEDYKKAIELLPEEWIGTDKGRVTKYAAMGMLARLFMFRSDFASAKPLLKTIMDSGKYGMEEEYVNCFTDSHDNGKERVWEVQFNGGQTGEGQFFSTGNLPEGFDDPSVMPFSGFSSAMLVADSLYNSYETGDLRRDLAIRKGWVDRNGVLDTVSKFFIKYNHYDAYTPKTQQDWANNLPVLRYTDVAMMYAEVLNKEAYIPGGEAFEILNAVRSRAGLPSLTAAELPDKEGFLKAIMTERRHEFAFEGLRWRDLLRWGIAKEVMNMFFADRKEGGGLYSMQDHQRLFAIPFNEISRYNDESVMWQNPGY